MADPIVFIIRNRVKDGMFDDFRVHYQSSIPLRERTKQGTLAQLAYVNDDKSEVFIVRVFPDAESFDLQLMGADERTKTTYRFIEPTFIEIYGTPNQYALDVIRKVTGSDVEVSVKPHYIGGFFHTMPGEL